ncbi:MAG: CHC2 zinc finger domain-containing protein [Parabacteroides sp.]|nr:CHC2 zinc finger domain-containing protein [Parabacteroides sp.]
MRNSKEEITALKDAVRIEQVIGTYVQLENKTGGNYLGLCPFHDDTSPSMHVHTEKQIFKCFACNEGGDVIAFISKIKSCSFAGAVNLLRQEWCNGSVPPAQHTLRREKAKEQKPPASPAQLAAMEANNVKFMRSLYGFHPPLASVGDIRLVEDTGLEDLTWMDGGKYHPDCRGIAQTYVDYEVGMAGSSVPREFKAMAGRIVFPIRDENNRLVAFAGRTTQSITEENKKHIRKYMNSKSSDLYNKSRTLYGLHLAAEAIRTETFAFLTEGYKDTLAMVAAGFKNTVAQCGAAFTDDQAQLLKRYTKRVAVLMDADDRGREIAASAITVLHRHGIQTSDLLLPPGEDPDSLFRRLGKHSFRTIVSESQLTGHLQTIKESTGVDLAFVCREGEEKGAGVPTTRSCTNGAPTGVERIPGSSSMIVMQSDRPRLIAREQDLQNQMRHLGSKRFLFGQGPERMQINTELMKLRSQLSEVSKQLNRPVVWYK